MTPAIDKDMARILDAARAAPKIDLRAMPITEARATFIAQQTPWAWCPHPMHAVHDLEIPTAAGPMRARLYHPTATDGLPLVIFAHGGGWTFGNIDTHDGTMRWLAATSACAVLGFDYRLAPEHPFPAAHEDMIAAIAFAHTGALGPAFDPTRLALAGDSAGANIALGALMAMRDNGQKAAATACLFYGCYAPVFDTESHSTNGVEYLLTTDMMRWYWRNFLGGHDNGRAPATCAPLFADLNGLPPLYLNAAGLDPLLDDTTILSARLARAGVRHRLDIWPGVVHGFLRLARELPLAQQALIAAGSYLREFFTVPSITTIPQGGKS
ncbi:MAG: alpha/beta hydrolase [Beijerinckiaceae bacterium]